MGDRRDSVGQSADDVLKTSKHHDLRTRIAAVQQAHRWGVFRCNDGYARTCCRCQWRETPDSPTHAEHVADAVIRELCIHREDMNEWAVLAEGFRGHRYVTHWEPNE